MGLSGIPPDELAAWVEASCAAQGVPVKVTDPTVRRRVGVLLGASEAPRGGARGAGDHEAPRAASGAPNDRDPVGVEPLDSRRSGPNLGVVDHRGDDGALLVERTIHPGAA